MRTLLFASFLLVVTPCWTQTWQWSKHIGGPGQDGAFVADIDPAGNIYMFGNYAMPVFQTTHNGCYFEGDTLNGSSDAFLAKFDGQGEIQWARSISSPYGNVTAGALVLDTAGTSFYTVGSFPWSCILDTCTISAPWGAGVFLAKWNLDGRCLWARTIATSGLVEGSWGVRGYGIAMDDEGELLVSMRTSPIGMTQADGQDVPTGSFFGKYDSDGQLLWLKPFTAFSGTQKWVLLYTLRYHNGRIYGHGPAAIQQSGDTTVVDTIMITGRQGGGNAIVSIDPATGVAEWFRLDGFPNGQGGKERIAVDPMGGIVVVGAYGSSAVFGDDTLASASPYAKAYIAKYLMSGDLAYVREFAGSNTFGFAGVDVDDEGRIALTGVLRGQIDLAGITYTATGVQDMFVSLHDPDGDPLGLVQASGGEGRSVRFLGEDLVVASVFSAGIPAGTTTIGGETYTSHGYEDIVLARTGLPTSIAPKSGGDDRLLIYANPNQGSFRLVVPEAVRYARDLVLRVYDGTGRLLHQQKLDMGEERPKVDLFGVSPGFYMVTLGNGQRTYSGMVVVE